MKKPSSVLPKSKNKFSSSSLRLALESRLVFDGAALATAVEVQQEIAVDNTAAVDAGRATASPGEPNAGFAPETMADAVGYRGGTVEESIPPPVSIGIALPESSTPAGLIAEQDNPSPPALVIDSPRADDDLLRPLNPLPNPPLELPVFTAEVSHQFSRHFPGMVDVETVKVIDDPLPSEILVNLRSGTTASSPLIFVDSRVDDLQPFLADRGGEVIMLDPNRDGVGQIAAALAGRTAIETIHILSHGDAGQLHLGDATLNAGSIGGEHADELAAIKAALSSTADILIYGCDVAAGVQGQAFVDALAAATGADVAASTDATGASSRGGDWTLESASGVIESANLALSGYDGLLAAPVIGGAVAGQAVNDNATMQPFSAVTLSDADPVNSQSLSVTLDTAAKGALSNLGGGSYDAGTGIYTFSGDANAAQTAIRGLIFTPAANRVAISATETTTFTISVNDGTTTVTNNTSTVVSTSINDAPVAAADAVAIAEDAASVTGNVLSNDTDADFGDTKTVQGIALGTVVGPVTGGVGTPVTGVYGTFTLGGEGSYTYALDNTLPAVQALAAGQTATESFTYTVKDSVNSSSTAIITATLTGVNDRPIVTASAIGLTQVEDAVNVFTVGNLLTNVGNAPIWTDVDNNSMGIAITAAVDTSVNGMTGVWQYQLSGGAWTPFPAVGLGTALLLPGDAQVRFVVTANSSDDNLNSGAVSLTYTAWDTGSGTVGGSGDTTSPTVTSPFSSVANSATLSVTPANDAPVFSAFALTVNENASAALTGNFTTDSSLIGGLAGNLRLYDPDNSTAQILYRVEELPTQGTLTLNGATLAVGSLFNQSNIGGITYTPTVGELTADTTDRVYFTIRDGAGGIIGDTGKNTGVNPWAYLDINIQDVNAQIAVSGATVTIAEDNAHPGVAVIAPVNVSISDADDPGNLRTLTVTSLPTATFGTLQYWDGGSYQTATTGLVFTQAQLTDAAHPALRFSYTTTTEPTDQNGVLVAAQSQTSFTVHVEDNHAAPLAETFADTTVTITITPGNDAPVLTTHNLTVVQGSSNQTIDAGRLAATDPDSPANLRTYTVSIDPTRGYLTLNGELIGRGSTFTEAQLTGGLLKYTTNDSYYYGPDSLQVFVTDSHGGVSNAGTITIDITQDNALPTPIHTDTPPDGSGSSVSVTGTLRAVVPESLFFGLDSNILSGSGNATVNYTVISKPSHGDIFLNGALITYGAAGIGTNFSQADINVGKVVYRHDASEPDTYGSVGGTDFNDTISIRAVSGTATLTQTVTVTITPVNDTPTITQTVSSHNTNETGGLLMEQNADGSDGIASALADLSNVVNAKRLTPANFAFHDGDTSPQLTYVVETAVGGSVARWNGTAWTVVTRFTSAELGAGNIAYFHNPAADVATAANTTGSGSVTVYLIDGGVIEAGDVSVTGGNFVEADSATVTDADGNSRVNAKHNEARSPSRTVTFTITDVNDAPLASNTSFTVTEFSSGLGGQTSHIQVLDTSLIAASDADTANGGWTYTLTALPVYGTIQRDTGGIWTDLVVNGTFSHAELAGGGLRYVNTGRVEVTSGFSWSIAHDSFQFKVNDGETGSTPNTLDSAVATVSVFLRPINQPPVVVNNGPGSTPEGGALKITGALLGSADAANDADIVKAVDPDNSRVQVQYRITGNVSHGVLYLGDPTTGAVTKQLSAGSAFTLEDIQSGKIWYQHNGTESVPYGNQDSFTYAISDASGMAEPTATFVINIIPVNDAPVVTGLAGGAIFTEGDTGGAPNVSPILIDAGVTLTDSDLANNGADFRGGSLRLTYAAGGSNVISAFDQLAIKNTGAGAGQIGVSGTSITYGNVVIGGIDATENGQNGAALKITFDTNANTALTVPAVKALIEAIAFSHNEYDNAAAGIRTLNYTLIDGGGIASYSDSKGATFTGADTWTGTATVSVAAANDRPVLTVHAGGGNLGLGTISEDAIASAAFQVASFTTVVNGSADATHTGIVDVDTGAVGGIAVTSLGNAATGHWEYSADGASGWTTITGVSATHALLLAASDYVRFVPDGNNGGIATLGYLAWDASSGSTRSYADSTTNAIQTSAYSTAADTAEIIVTPVNDAPVATPASLAAVNEDAGAVSPNPNYGNSVAPGGATVGALFGAHFTEVDASGNSTLVGVAITANATSAGQGKWQYSTDGGSIWNDIPTSGLGDANALVLGNTANDQIRFLPDQANYNGVVGDLTVRLSDGTAFTAGTGQDLGVIDATRGWSNAVALSTRVTAVNDAPAISSDKTIATGVNEGSALVISNAGVGLVAVDDIEAARNEGTGINQGKVSVTIAVPNGLAHGKVTLGSLAGLGIIAGANNTHTVTIRGSLTDVNAALNGLGFTPGVDTNTSETVTVTVNDRGNNGTGTTTALTALQTITLTNIAPSNNAPTVTAPVAVTATEDTAYTFSGGVIRIADVDVRSANIVSLTLNLSSAGTFRFSGATGLFTDATATTPYALTNEAAGANVVVYGILANLNAALNGLVYNPANNLNSVNIGSDYIGGDGKAHLSITVNDRGYGQGGAQGAPLSATSTVDIAVDPVNDAPGITGPSADSAYIEQGFAVTIGAGVTVTDAIDDTQLSGATVTIGAADFRAGDTLAATASGGIDVAYDVATHTLTLSNAASIASYNTVLQSVTFSNSTNDAPTSGGATTRTITWQVTDNNADGAANGARLSNAATSTITITPVSDAPSGTNNTVTTHEDQTYTFTTADFGFSDPLDNPADPLTRVLITELAANGTLQLNGVNVAAGDYILAADIAADKLTFVPDANYNTGLVSISTVNPALVFGNGNPTITSTLTVSGATGNLSDLNLALDITHTWISDVIIKLTAPDGTEQTLFNSSGGSFDNLVVTLDDEAAISVTAIPSSGGVTIPGTYQPANPLSVFDGKNLNGTWTLTVTDDFPVVDNGILNSWSLTRTIAPSFTFQVEDTGSLLNGGVILDPTPNNITINVTPLNDAPVLTALAANPSVTENATTVGAISVDPVALLASAAIADLDLTTTAALNSAVFGAGSITARFTDAYVAGDVLFVDPAVLPTGVSISGTDTGIATALTINLAATTTAAQVNSILAAISYKSTSDNPTLNDTDTTRAYQIVVNDGNNNQGAANAGGPAGLDGNIINGTLTLAPANDAPVVDLNGASGGTDNAVTWAEAANAAHVAIAIAPNATVTDVDNTNMTRLVIQMGGIVDGNSEVLGIGGVDFQLGATVSNVSASGFLVSYDSGARQFTLTPPPASVALATSFQTLIQGMTYINTTDNPGTGNRTASFTITDAGYDNDVAAGGELVGNTAIATITVVPANDQPVITGLDPAAYFENAVNATAAIIDGGITLTDIDSADYNGGTLTVSGLVAGQDTVSLPVNAAAVLGNVQINGGNVEYYDGVGWVVIGTHSGGVGADFIVAFNANATAAIVERVMENLAFANSSDNPTLTRTLTLAVNDNDGGTVQNATVGVTLKLDNDAPVMTATVLGGTYTEQNATALRFIGGAIGVSDPDSPADFFAGGVGSLTVALDGYVTGDTLSVLNQGNGAGQIGVSGSTIRYGNVIFATTSGGNGAPLVITFTSAAATPAAVQALLPRLAYRNTADNDPTVNNTDPSRVFTVTLDDGGNTKDATSASAALTAVLTGTINLTAVNDAPMITSAGAAASYTENAAATGVDSSVTLTDADDTQIAGGTISITGNLLAGDVLAVINTGNISGGYDADTGILTLSGTDTLSNYQTVLRSLTYLNSTDDPTDNTAKTSRTLTYSLADANSDLAGAATGTATKTINVIPQTDAPVLGGAGNSRSYTEDDAVGIALEPALTLIDADDTHMTDASVTIVAGLTSGDVLSAVTAGTGIIAAYDPAAGVLGLTGVDTTAHYLQVLQSVKFYSTSNDPTAISATRTISWHVNDADSDLAGMGSSNTPSTLVNVTAQNDAPIGVNNTLYAIEAGGVNNAILGFNPSGNVLTDDTDVDSGDSKTVTGLRTGTEISGSGTVGTVGIALVGAYGSLTLNSDGSYSYAVDNANAAVQALRVSGQTLTEYFTYTLTDTGGLSDTAQIAVTIDGRNDNPVGVNDAGAAVETGIVAGSNAAGNVLTNDTDADSAGNGETKTVTAIRTGAESGSGTAGTVGGNLIGAYGTLVLQADGDYAYAADNSNAAVNALAAGATLAETFTYSVRDAADAVDTAELVITITGGNDAPVAAADIANTDQNTPIIHNAANGVLPNDTGTMLTVAAVHGLGGSVGSPVAGSNGGTFTLNADGSYTFNPGAAFLDLAAGQTRDTLVNYTASDGAGGTANTTLTVTVSGNNDNPVGVNDTAVAIEAGGIANATPGVNASGNVLTNDTDADTGDTHMVFAIRVGNTEGSGTAGTLGSGLAGQYGTLTLNANGGYTYVADDGNAAVQALRITGQTLTDAFNYTVKDAGNAIDIAVLSIVIDGRNDAPIAHDDSAAAIEAGGIANGTPGANATGNVLANDRDVDAVANGESKTVVAVSSGVNSGNVGAALIGLYGTLILNSDGGYAYVADNANAAVQALRASGQSVAETFNYTMADATGATSAATLTITVDGRNDAPVAVNDNAAAIEADGIANGTPGANATGNVLANDREVDAVANGESKTVVAVSSGANSGNVGAALIGLYGTLTLNSDGGYAYVADNANAAVQALRASGQSVAETFNYTMADATGATSAATLTITVDGRNDAPVANNDTAPPVVAGNKPSVNVLANDTDAEDGKPVVIDLDPATPGIQSTFANADGSFAAVDGVVTFSPANPAFAGNTSLNYVAVDSAGAVSNIGVASFTITPTAPNNGALIDITNPPRSFAPPFLGGGTNPRPLYEDTSPAGHEGALSQPLNFDHYHDELYLIGSLRNQVVLEQRNYSFDVPRWAFQHSNPTEKLEFEATQPDGSPLPSWLKFDPNKLRFTGIPPLGAMSTEVMVTARDSYGNEVQAYFTVTVNREPRHFNQRNAPPVGTMQGANGPVARNHGHDIPELVAVGKAGLTEQIQTAGKFGRLQESQALLDSLKQF